MSPVKFQAESGHRVSDGRADAYGKVTVHLDGSWQGFAHTNSTPGAASRIIGAGQRGTVIFFDASGNSLFAKELWNFNINPGGDRQDNTAGGPNDIPTEVVAAATQMALAITDGSRDFDWRGTLDSIARVVQIAVAVATI